MIKSNFFIHAGALHFINRIANKTPEKVFFISIPACSHSCPVIKKGEWKNANGGCDHVIMCHYNTILLRQLGKNFYFV